MCPRSRSIREYSSDTLPPRFAAYFLMARSPTDPDLGLIGLEVFPSHLRRVTIENNRARKVGEGEEEKQRFGRRK